MNRLCVVLVSAWVWAGCSAFEPVEFCSDGRPGPCHEPVPDAGADATFDANLDAGGDSATDADDPHCERYSYVASDEQVLLSSSDVSLSLSSVARLANDDYIVLYRESNNVHGKIYNNAHEVRVDSFQINSFSSNQQTEPQASVLGNGNFVVVWTTVNAPGGDGRDIAAKIFDANAATVLEEWMVNTVVGVEFHNAHQISGNVSASPNGFAVTWTADNDGAARSQLYNNEGSPIGVETTLNTASAPHRGTIPFGLDNGQYVVVWLQNQGGSTKMRSRGLSTSGDPIGSSDTEVSDIHGLSATRLSEHSFLLVGRRGDYVYGQLMNSAGAPIGGRFGPINQVPGPGNSIRQAVAGSDGQGLVVWIGSDSDGTGIRGRVVRGDGTIDGDEFGVNDSEAGAQSSPTAVALSDGTLVVAWLDQGDPAQPRIISKTFTRLLIEGCDD